jgi:hypothetical protein
MSDQKRILMIAMQKPVEALRMASGLTLLDDAVSIGVWGAVPASAEATEQLEALEFAEVPLSLLDPASDAMTVLAERILDSDVVFCV